MGVDCVFRTGEQEYHLDRWWVFSDIVEDGKYYDTEELGKIIWEYQKCNNGFDSYQKYWLNVAHYFCTAQWPRKEKVCIVSESNQAYWTSDFIRVLEKPCNTGSNKPATEL